MAFRFASINLTGSCTWDGLTSHNIVGDLLVAQHGVYASVFGVIFTSTVPAENVHTADQWFLTTKTVVDVLKANKITGVDYIAAY